MALDKKCPKCGSTKVQLSNEESKNGCLWFVLFGWVFLAWVFIKWCIGFIIFLLYDWWMAIIHSVQKKGHVWQCKKWFSGRRKIYFCHDCGHNFRA